MLRHSGARGVWAWAVNEYLVSWPLESRPPSLTSENLSRVGWKLRPLLEKGRLVPAAQGATQRPLQLSAVVEHTALLELRFRRP